jgi:dolichol-phosphate mannosyltransferase
MNDSVSVVIPAYNEEKVIETTVKVVLRLTASCIKDYEVIIVDDGSTDRTGQIIKRLAKRNEKIKIITHAKNQGLGSAYLDGINHSTKTYVTGYPADNDQSCDILTDLILYRKRAGMVMGYMTNIDSREIYRKILSLLFVKIMNLLFNLNLKYYNGYFICRVDLLRKIKLKSSGFTLFAEAKIRLIKKGIQFMEIPYETKRRAFGNSKALRWKNIFQTLCLIVILFIDVHIKNDL